MFVDSKEDLIVGTEVTVIGKVARKDGAILYIKTEKAEIPIKYKDILHYSQDNVIVSGLVDGQGCVVEDKVDLIDGELDPRFLHEFVELNKKFTEIF